MSGGVISNAYEARAALSEHTFTQSDHLIVEDGRLKYIYDMPQITFQKVLGRVKQHVLTIWPLDADTLLDAYKSYLSKVENGENAEHWSVEWTHYVHTYSAFVAACYLNPESFIAIMPHMKKGDVSLTAVLNGSRRV